MLGSFRPNPVEGLIVFGIPLAPDRIADAGFGHQVPFISGINEHLGAIDLAVLHDYFRNAPALFLHGSQALLEINAHLRLIEHLEEDVFGHMRLEGPHGGISGVQVTDRGVLGGAWDEPNYMFVDPDAQSPFLRAANIGFRCVKYIDANAIPKEAFSAMPTPRRDLTKEKPVSDQVFQE